MLYIFDIDGVLADITHLLPLIQGKEKDFETYYKRIGEAKAIKGGIAIADSILNTLNNDGNSGMFYFITGRNESSRELTTQWLEQELSWNKKHYTIHMRGNTDRRYAQDLKREIIQRISIETGVPFSDMVVFEDDTNVARMYKQLGCYVCHVKHDKARS
jgi:acid phosphatase class B